MIRSSRMHRRIAVVALALTLAVGAGSCSRSLPTAPLAGDAPVTPVRGVLPARYGGGEVDSEVCVTLAVGVLPEAIANDYGAVLVGNEAYERQAIYRPPSGQAPLDFAVLLRTDPRIVTAEPNALLESAETRQQSFAFDDGHGSAQTYEEQPAAQAIQLAPAHAIGRGHGVRVAILDTGADLTHPALAGRVVADYDLVSADYDASEVADGIDNDGDGNVDEAYGHGTHVAGIVALTAPAAELLVVRVLDSDGRGDILCVAAGIRWAVAHGAQVINLSLGSLNGSDAVQDALEEAENAGVTVLASAGNWGAAQPEEFPARSSHAIAVAATDATAQPAAFTSYANHVRISAPGVGVRSAYPGGQWRLWSGTSMSTPFVSGAVAVVRGIHPDWTSDRVLSRLYWTTQPLQNVPPAMQGMLGSGMLNLASAVLRDTPGAGDAPPVREILRRPR